MSGLEYLFVLGEVFFLVLCLYMRHEEIEEKKKTKEILKDIKRSDEELGSVHIRGKV